MEQDYIYGVARIRALEGNLFSDDTIGQLLQCKTYDECMSFLKSRGWGNGNAEQTDTEMFDTERKKTWDVLHEIVEDESECRFLTITDEFHNLKAAVKQACSKEKVENIFYNHCTYEPDFLINCIRQGNFSDLPDDMADAACEAKEVLLKTGDGQMCDVIIDRAALEALKKAGDESSNEFVKQYVDMVLTVTNIKIAIRCAGTGKNQQFIKSALVSCNGIDAENLADAAEDGTEGIYEYLENSGYGEAVDAFKKSKSIFECWCDNKIIESMKPQKYNSFTIGPIIAYVLARENEIKTAKIILLCKQNGFDEEFIKERVRVMYV